MKKMKQSILIALLSILTINPSIAQDVVNITYKVDITNYLAGGATLNPGGIRIGGNFTELGLTLPDWTPTDPSCAMADEGSNIWSITIAYPSTLIGEGQLFKFVNGDWNPIGWNEGLDFSNTLISDGCGLYDFSGNINRLIIIPSDDATFLWCWDHCTSCSALCEITTGLNAEIISSTSATLLWNATSGAEEYKIHVLDLSSGVRHKVKVPAEETSYTLSEILSAGNTYAFKVKTLCESTSASLSEAYFFTMPLKLTQEDTEHSLMSIYPNPASDNIYVTVYAGEMANAIIRLLDATGNELQKLLPLQPEHEILIDLRQYSAGIYFIQLQTGNEITTRKIIKE